jgi:hypothetical protein
VGQRAKDFVEFVIVQTETAPSYENSESEEKDSKQSRIEGNGTYQ